MQWSDTVTWTAVVSLVFSLVKKGETLACFRCYSLAGSDTDCEDEFQIYDIARIGNLLEKDCRVGAFDYEASYCVKIKGKKEKSGETVVIRTCSNWNWGSQCGEIIFQQGMNVEDSRERIHGCLDSCPYDGCNHSSSVKATILQTTLRMVIGYLFWRL